MPLFRTILAPLLACILFAPTIAAQEDVTSQAEKFERLLRIVDGKYVDSVATDQLVEYAIKGMLKELDPHSIYISAEDRQRMNEPLKGNFEGIGVQFNIFNDTILVLSAISGGPSEKLGIRSGDKIIEIEGETVAGIGITNKDVMDKLRGEKGSEVKVGIKRQGQRRLVKYTIVRDKVPIYSVDAAYMATPEIGYIKLNRFSAKSMNEIHEKMEHLQAKGMEHLILDLRGNSGGYLRTAIDLADEFLGSRKLIVYTEGRSYPTDKKFATVSGDFETGKLVVLIDEGSASASEIVSGAIQDHDRGIIIGRRSFGKGLVQKPFRLSDGSEVRLTVSRYYTPSGRCIQKPYDDGVDAYRKEVRNRMKNGELMSADSIDIPDSLVFNTLVNDRTVYGGGGIMPDIFIPLDTSLNSDYYQELRRAGILSDFVLNHLNGHREQLSKDFENKDAFVANFEVDAQMMDNFLAFAEKSDIEHDAEGFATSESLIKSQLKALMGRNLFDLGVYYEVTNQSNETFLTAIRVIEDDTFDKMKLVYHEPSSK